MVVTKKQREAQQIIGAKAETRTFIMRGLRLFAHIPASLNSHVMPLPEQLLPARILAKASLCGNEYAWRIDDVEDTIRAAHSSNLATIGGQIQFRLPDGTCELYWLAADSSRRRDDEDWSSFVSRSANEVIEKFRSLQAKFNFVAEGVKEFTFLSEKHKQGFVLADYLYFILYFEAETAA